MLSTEWIDATFRLIGALAVACIVIAAVLWPMAEAIMRKVIARRVKRMPDDYELPIEDDQWLK